LGCRDFVLRGGALSRYWRSSPFLRVLDILVFFVGSYFTTDKLVKACIQECSGSHLYRFIPARGAGLAREFVCPDCEVFAGAIDFAGDVDEFDVIFEALSLCFKTKSPIFTRRMDTGILLTLISIRVRSPCA
jgi:hypothetical protein